MSRNDLAQDGIPPWAIVSSRRRNHILRVTALLQDWAAGLGLGPDEIARWRCAGLLHDALRSAPVDVLTLWTPTFDGPPELRHGPAAAAAALHYGTSTDAEVLDAVRWHTVGSTSWGTLGRALYCADHLEPGRDSSWAPRASLTADFTLRPAEVLREVARHRQQLAAEAAWDVPEQSRQFWASLGL